MGKKPEIIGADQHQNIVDDPHAVIPLPAEVSKLGEDERGMLLEGLQVLVQFLLGLLARRK